MHHKTLPHLPNRYSITQFWHLIDCTCTCIHQELETAGKTVTMRYTISVVHGSPFIVPYGLSFPAICCFPFVVPCCLASSLYIVPGICWCLLLLAFIVVSHIPIISTPITPYEQWLAGRVEVLCNVAEHVATPGACSSGIGEVVALAVVVVVIKRLRIFKKDPVS